MNSPIRKRPYMNVRLKCVATSIAGNNAEGLVIYESRLTNGKTVTIAIQSTDLLEIGVEYTFSLSKDTPG
jgi:hypothetical protein